MTRKAAKNTAVAFVLVSTAALITAYWAREAISMDSSKTAPRAQPTDAESARYETATFGAGCFWGVEAAFRKVEGVKSTAVGYSGGHFDNPTYKDVCSGRTGHTEVAQVVFDPEIVSYRELLDVFWSIHDPTTLNRQGADVGVQYRSVIFYRNEEQRQAAEESRGSLDKSGKYTRPVVTAIEPFEKFWKAEEYHQQYLEKRGMASCHVSLGGGD